MTTSSPRSATPIDVHVGARVRLLRKLKHMSQEKLGEELGVTFQQVQKYENGANRIGASRLFSLSRVFDVPVTYFFEGLENQDGAGLPSGDSRADVLQLLDSAEGVALAEAFAQIKTPEIRKKVIAFMRSLPQE